MKLSADDNYGNVRGNYNKNVTTRRGISSDLSGMIESDKYKKESEQRIGDNINKYGRNGEQISKKINEGINDRMLPVPYNPDKYDDKYDHACYEKGFFENGNLALLGRLELLSDEQLQKIGENDYISGVDLNTLPDSIKENDSYVEGYLTASIMYETKGKGRR